MHNHDTMIPVIYVPKTTPRYPLLILVFSYLLYPEIVVCLYDSHYVAYNCEKTNNSFTPGSVFQLALNETLFSKLPTNASQAFFSMATSGTGIDQVNALFYCRPDVDSIACHNCVVASAEKITEQCEFMKEAIVWFEECTLRYSNRSIFSIDEEDPLYMYTNDSGIVNDYLLDPYKDKFDSAMDALVKQASISLQGFATTQVNLSSSKVLHCKVQCSTDIIGEPCEKCLRSALNQRDNWADTMIFMPSCFMRVDLYNLTTSTTITQGPSKIKYVVSAAMSATVFVLAAVVCYFRHGALRAIAVAVFAKASAIVFCWFSNDPDVEGPRILKEFTYRELYWATGGFKRKNLLGEGGFGQVYRGVVRCKEVAVKRFKEDIYKGLEDEFISEVNNNFNADHVNIVKVIGCCNQGERKLLVYELVKNNCLRNHLRGIDEDPKQLTWEKRMKIAVGTARGLKYLHEECNPNIIHRDIKPSNILLDSNFEPKVGDFGLAKVLPEGVTRVTTDLKGTYPYWDPEYETNIQVTQKSDVYSFGIVLLELITGNSPRLLHKPLQINTALSLLQGLEGSKSDTLEGSASSGQNDSISDAQYVSASDVFSNCASSAPKDPEVVPRGPASDAPKGPATEGPEDSVSPHQVKDAEALAKLIDQNLEAKFDVIEMGRMIICAALCVHPIGEGRLSMSQVVSLLEEGSLRSTGVAQIIRYAESGSEPESSTSSTYPDILGLSDLNRLATRVLTKNTPVATVALS